MITVVASGQQIGVAPRILIAVVLCAGAVPALYVGVKALVVIRRIPTRKMTHRQAVQVSAILGVCLVLMAAGALTGNLSSDQSSKAAGTLGGLFLGAFVWLVLCWTVGGVARAHQAKESGSRPGL